MSIQPMRLRVAVPVHLYALFDYSVSAEIFEKAQAGMRVRIPFGHQTLVGVIVEKVAQEETLDPKIKLKAILALLDELPILDEKILKILSWAAQYYLFPIGEVIHAALPSRLRQGHAYQTDSLIWRVNLKQKENLKNLTSVQKKLYQAIETNADLDSFKESSFNALAKKGLIYSEIVPISQEKKPFALAEKPLIANTEQQYAIDQILKSTDHYQAFLLDGLTGSGKTEVYLQVMQEILQQNKQVLVLVPEIGLTPQTIQRFKSRFHCDIAVLHSGLNETQRLKAWQAAQTGQAQIILGTRLAIYTPLPNLGLIILDEEHDLSFKQQESFRYHAKDVALYRAYYENCPIILGSATPSFDSYALVEQKKLTHLTLNQRAGKASLPKVHLIDLKITKKQLGLSQNLLTKIKICLEHNEQVLIFLNRRGYAPVLICESCAWQAKCPHCDTNLTVHHQPYHHLRCHHCGTIQSNPHQCPACQQPNLKPLGMGTAQVETHLKTLFPNYEILRVDRDSTQTTQSWQKIYNQIHENKPLILLGTQMLAKGHHFPNVSLVAILDIDSGLFSSDFRAIERTAQLIVQVTGRAGREEKKGTVYLQTLRPDHPLFEILLKKGYRTFAQHSLTERKSAILPPYRYTALIRCESKDQNVNQTFLKQHVNLWQQDTQHHIEVWGPIPAPMAKKAGRYQAHVLLLSHDRRNLHFYLQSWWKNMLNQKPSTMKLSLDIDPQELN